MIRCADPEPGHRRRRTVDTDLILAGLKQPEEPLPRHPSGSHVGVNDVEPNFAVLGNDNRTGNPRFLPGPVAATGAS